MPLLLLLMLLWIQLRAWRALKILDALLVSGVAVWWQPDVAQFAVNSVAPVTGLSAWADIVVSKPKQATARNCFQALNFEV